MKKLPIRSQSFGITILAGFLFFQQVHSQAVPTFHRLGSWGQTIKKSGTSATDKAWDQDDIPAYVQALQETKQNFVIYNINTANQWTDFIALLEELKADSSDIQVVAAMEAPHLNPKGEGDIWFPSGVPDCKVFINYGIEQWNYDHDVITRWHQAWRAAATNCSALSTNYPNLAAFSINDFTTYVENPAYPAVLFGNKLTLSQVQEITDAAHSVNTDFKFIPLTYYGNIGKGYVLGANYGVKLFADEDLYVALSFCLNDAPKNATLEFFHLDTVNECGVPWYVFKQVFVNGFGDTNRLALEESVVGDQGIQHFADDIASHLRKGTNTIYFRLDPRPYRSDWPLAGVHNGMPELFWWVWDVSVKGSLASLPSASFEFTEFTEKFFVKYHGGTDPSYAPSDRGMGFPESGNIRNADFRVPPSWSASHTLPNDPEKGFLARRLIAGKNEDYLLRDFVDGLMVTSTKSYTLASPEVTCTGTDPAYTGTVSLWTYDHDDYEALLESTKEYLGDKTFVALHWAMLTGATVEPDVLADQLLLASDIADVTAVWNWPMGVHYLDDGLGIFAQNPSTETDYSVMAFWPGRQMDVPGWYQQFIHTAVADEELTINVMDSRDADADATSRLFKSVQIIDSSGSVSTVYGPVDVATDPGETSEVSVGTVSLAAGQSLLLLVEMGSQDLSDWPVRVWFKVKDASGTLLDAASFTFESGLAEDTAIDIYETVRDTFADIWP